MIYLEDPDVTLPRAKFDEALEACYSIYDGSHAMEQLSIVREYTHALEEQLKTLREAAASAENDLRIHGTGAAVIGARHKLYEELRATSVLPLAHEEENERRRAAVSR